MTTPNVEDRKKNTFPCPCRSSWNLELWHENTISFYTPGCSVFFSWAGMDEWTKEIAQFCLCHYFGKKNLNYHTIKERTLFLLEDHELSWTIWCLTAEVKVNKIPNSVLDFSTLGIVLPSAFCKKIAKICALCSWGQGPRDRGNGKGLDGGWFLCLHFHRKIVVSGWLVRAFWQKLWECSTPQRNRRKG